MAKANNTIQRVNKIPPAFPSRLNEQFIRVVEPAFVNARGYFNELHTTTNPVMEHITIVSQKTDVMEIRLCSWQESSKEEPAVIDVEPRPASLVNSPRQIPYLAAANAVITPQPEPTKMAFGVNIPKIIYLTAGIM